MSTDSSDVVVGDATVEMDGDDEDEDEEDKADSAGANEADEEADDGVTALSITCSTFDGCSD